MSQSEKLRSVLDQTLATIGLEPNPDSLQITDYPRISYATLQDASGLLDICVKGVSRSRSEATRLLQTDPDAEDYTLNGLLRAEHGKYVVTHGPADTPDGTDYVSVSVYSSPVGINEAYIQAGRIPGQDIFELVRQDGAAFITPGPYSEAAHQRKLLVADRVDWATAEHDLNLSDHPQSWYAMPPRVLDRIAERAGELKVTPRDIYFGTVGEKLAAAKRFAGGLDDLAAFSRVLYSRLMHIDEAARLRESPQQMVESTVKLRPRYLSTHEARMNHIYRYTNVFKALGIIERDVRFDTHKENALQTLIALYMSHLAESLIVLQEIHPAEAQSKWKTARRLSLWSKVKEWAEAANPYPSEYDLRI